MIDDLLMLTCGWVAGVITTLAIRQAQDDERRPLDPALLPKSSPIGWTSQPMAIDKPAISADLQHRAPTFSPYAPKRARRVTPHGEGHTLTQEAFTNGTSAALSGHGAQAPRRRSSSWELYKPREELKT